MIPAMLAEAKLVVIGGGVAGVVEWNLFDIDAKFGDVEPLETVLDYLDRIEPFEAASARVAAEAG